MRPTMVVSWMRKDVIQQMERVEDCFCTIFSLGFPTWNVTLFQNQAEAFVGKVSYIIFFVSAQLTSLRSLASTSCPSTRTTILIKH